MVSNPLSQGHSPRPHPHQATRSSFVSHPHPRDSTSAGHPARATYAAARRRCVAAARFFGSGRMVSPSYSALHLKSHVCRSLSHPVHFVVAEAPT
ncbi:hypothetical protein DENSPDRAFT_127153 [Dentipellis sp. KUC8613]|nr:hypothetical protein DENSPDRAFT_127153 [Dentipellis sp. KUC8613]